MKNINKEFDKHHKSILSKLDDIRASVDYWKELQRKDMKLEDKKLREENSEFWLNGISELDKELDNILSFLEIEFDENS